MGQTISVGDYLLTFTASLGYYYPWVKVLSVTPNRFNYDRLDLEVEYYNNREGKPELTQTWVNIDPNEQSVIAHNEEDIAMWTLANI